MTAPAPRAGVPAAVESVLITEQEIADKIAELPAALRTRVLRGWLRGAGVPDLQAVHLDAVDALLVRWRGQGRVDLPDGAGVVRASGTLRLVPVRDGGGPPPAPHDREEPDA